MKYVLALVALIALIGFVGSSHAADPKPARPHVGHFLKVEDNVVSYKGGKKGTSEEHTVKIDDKTVVTIDGKDGKIANIKPGEYIEITGPKGGPATLIAASSSLPTTQPSSSAAK